MASPYGVPTAAPPRPVRRRRRWPWVLLTLVVVLAGLFVAADRIALSLAEDKAASTLQTSQHLPQKPDVSVAGFPFLTQLAAGEFGEVTISADGIDVGQDRSLHLAKVTVHLHDVTVPSDYSSVRAKTATADARITYADLSTVVTVPVHYGGAGRLVAEPTVSVLGQTFHGTVSAVVHASSSDGLRFTDPQVTAAGVTLPDVAGQALAAVFAKSVSLRGLPFGVQVDGVDATASGLVLHLSGQNLVYERN